MSKKGEYVRFKNYKRKIKSLFLIYADFESILISEDIGKQNPNKSYTNKYQNPIACSYGYKLECVDDKFSKPFKSCLGEDTVYNFINGMVEESKYFSDVMTKKDDEDFENSSVNAGFVISLEIVEARNIDTVISRLN